MGTARQSSYLSTEMQPDTRNNGPVVSYPIRMLLFGGILAAYVILTFLFIEDRWVATAFLLGSFAAFWILSLLLRGFRVPSSPRPESGAERLRYAMMGAVLFAVLEFSSQVRRSAAFGAA